MEEAKKMIKKNDEITTIDIILHTKDGKIEKYTPEDHVLFFKGKMNNEIGVIGAANINADIDLAKMFLINLMKIAEEIKDSIEREELTAKTAMWAINYWENDDLEGLRKDPKFNKNDEACSVVERMIIKKIKGDI